MKRGFGYYSWALALAPVVMGIVYAQTGSPQTAFWVAIGLLAVVTVVYLVVAVPRTIDENRSERPPEG